MENHLNETDKRYLQFNLGEEKYALHLLSVKEVIPVPDTTPLPNSPGHYQGIMNLRGQIISIIDLRKKLNIQIDKERQTEEAVVIVEIENVGIGLIVDSINKVLNIDVSKVSEVPEIKSKPNGKYIMGVHRGEDHLTIILDMHKVLDIQEILKMKNAA